MNLVNLTKKFKGREKFLSILCGFGANIFKTEDILILSGTRGCGYYTYQIIYINTSVMHYGIHPNTFNWLMKLGVISIDQEILDGKTKKVKVGKYSIDQDTLNAIKNMLEGKKRL